MTSIGAVASAYARLAHGQGEVAPVRAALRPANHRTASEQGAELAAWTRQKPDAFKPAELAAAAKVVDLPVNNRQAPEPVIRTQVAQAFVPFLAQQIAQEQLPEKAKAQRQKHEAVTEAYVLASDDSTRVLGPVRPRELIV